MKKELKDYLHLYLGCELLIKYHGEDVICKIMTVGLSGSCYAYGMTKDGNTFNSHGRHDDAKLILRPLSDMTLTEETEMAKEFDKGKGEYGLIKAEGHEVLYLLSKGFDLFYLIPEGLAIDKTTLMPKEQKDERSVATKMP